MRLGFITYKGATDETLMKRTGEGSERAFDELYSRYGQKMFAYFFRMLWKNKTLAEDFTQDLFIKVIHHAKTFHEGRNVSTWLYSIAHNMCKNEYRKQQIRIHVPVESAPFEGAVSQDELQIDLKAFKNRLDILLETLDEERKALFIMRFEDHMTVPEIAEILGIPEGTVKSKLFYLLKTLTGELKTYHPASLTR